MKNMKKICLFLQAAVCILLAVLLAAGAVGLYREGAARRAEDPTASVYTAENAAERLAALAPLFFVFLALLLAESVLGVRPPDPQKTGKRAGCAKPRADLKGKGVLQAAAVAAAVALIVAGILNGSAFDVLVKAINICTECIGLG